MGSRVCVRFGLEGELGWEIVTFSDPARLKSLGWRDVGWVK